MALTQELLDSGLPREVHSQLGYREVSKEECFNLVGFRLEGWVVPMTDPDGKPFQHDGKPFYRLKPATPVPDKNGKAAKYLSPRGGGCRPYFSPLLSQKELKGAGVIRITEGEKKADCLNHHGFPTIGLSGVDAWTDGRVGDRELLPELRSVNWDKRDVLLVFDSDVTVKESVRQSLYRLSDVLVAAGATVSIVLLPCELDGSKNGADDFLCRHGADAYRALERIARPAYTWKNKDTRVWWSPEPTEPHHKALTAWTVFDGIYAHRLSHGLYRFNGRHWDQVHGGSRDALKRPLHQWMDHMGWNRRGDSVIGSSVSELLARLEVETWDAEGLMSFANGTLRHGTFCPGHNRDDHLTFSFPFAYDAGAKCPRWHQFLKETLEAEDLIRLLRAAIRWSVIPKPVDEPFTHELAFDVHGPKRAGKGTLSEVLQSICGGRAGVGLIRSHTFSNANALHSLVGKRIALDPDASGRISDPGIFNSICSNEEVEVKKLYKDCGSARLGVVIWRFFNDSPGASGGGLEGMGRRIVTFRFERTVKKPDESLKRTLRAEAAGVFWWAWSMSDDEMNQALRDRGRVAAIRDASIEGALERDHVLRFSTVASQGTHRAADLYKAYRQWMDEEGQHPVSATKFGREIKKLPWVKPTSDWRGSYYETHQPTHQQLASHIGVSLDDDEPGELNPPADPTHQPNPPVQEPSPALDSQEHLVSLVSSPLKNKEREEEKEISLKTHMESEVAFQPTRPTRPTTGIPVYVDGKNGWTSPSGRIDKERVLLVDSSGNSHLIERKRISLKPTAPLPADLPF